MNSVLCRIALSHASIDAASFTAIRLISGAIFLALLATLVRRDSTSGHGSWISGLCLFAYAAAFSFAYISLSAGTGGLILFATVQFTMIGIGIWKGERPTGIECLGLAVALAGLLVLVAPGLQSPSPVGALLMATAGIAWGVYSLRGRSAKDPALATAENFIRSVPFVVILAAVFLPRAHVSPAGIGLAVASGAITSGLGYILWYTVLPHLTATRAAITQLAVPAIVTILGVLVLSEPVTGRFAIAATLMLGGVALAVVQRQSQRPVR